nr:hypothetical protein Iba_chr07cCG7590 [Ipomoea batatas]
MEVSIPSHDNNSSSVYLHLCLSFSITNNNNEGLQQRWPSTPALRQQWRAPTAATPVPLSPSTKPPTDSSNERLQPATPILRHHAVVSLARCGSPAKPSQFPNSSGSSIGAFHPHLPANFAPGKNRAAWGGWAVQALAYLGKNDGCDASPLILRRTKPYRRWRLGSEFLLGVALAKQTTKIA